MRKFLMRIKSIRIFRRRKKAGTMVTACPYAAECDPAMCPYLFCPGQNALQGR